LTYLSPRKIEWIGVDDHLGAKEDRSGYDEFKYDYIVRSRPDLYFAKDLSTSDLLPNDRILINPYYECLYDIPPGYNQKWSQNLTLCDHKKMGISDMFAIMPRALADPYTRVGYTHLIFLLVFAAIQLIIQNVQSK
jgi:hypothetical protein